MEKKYELKLVASGNIDDLVDFLNICKEGNMDSLHLSDFPINRFRNSLFFVLSRENNSLDINGMMQADMNQLIYAKDPTHSVTGLLDLSEKLNIKIELKVLNDQRTYGEYYLIENGAVLNHRADVMDSIEPEFICVDEYVRFIKVHNLDGRTTPNHNVIHANASSLHQISKEFSDAMLVIEKDDIFRRPAIISSDNYMRIQ